MKGILTIFRRLWRDKVSLSMWLLTIAAAIAQEPRFMWLLVLFIFRGIMWEGQYVDSLNKYVTNPKYRALLKLDQKNKVTIIDVIFQVIFMLGVVGAGLYLILH